MHHRIHIYQFMLYHSTWIFERQEMPKKMSLKSISTGWTANLWTVAFKSLNSWWLNQIDFFQLFNQSKFNSNWRIINKYLVDFYTWKKKYLWFSWEGLTTLDNQLWLHFKMKSKEIKHTLLKPIYVSLSNGENIVKLFFKSVTNALHIWKSAGDKIASADQVNNIQFLEVPFIKNWFFLSK